MQDAVRKFTLGLPGVCAAHQGTDWDASLSCVLLWTVMSSYVRIS
jgi:hypothetical protein